MRTLVTLLLWSLLPLACLAQHTTPGIPPPNYATHRYYAGLSVGRAEYYLPTQHGTFNMAPVLAPTLTAGAHLGRYVVAEVELTHARRVDPNTAILVNSRQTDQGGASFTQQLTAVWLRMGGSFQVGERLRLEVLPSLLVGVGTSEYDYLLFDYAKQAYTGRFHLSDSSTETYLGLGGRVCYLLARQLEASAQAGNVSSLSFAHRNSYLGINDYNGNYWSLGLRYCFGTPVVPPHS